MKTSTSKYIELESVPLSQLFDGTPGSVGLYIPSPDTKGSFRNSIAKISSAAKRYGSVKGKHSTVQTLLVLMHEGDSDIPVASKMLRVTLIDPDNASGRSKRYVESGGVRNRKVRKKEEPGSQE